MSQDWNSYDRAAEKGPWAFALKIIILITLITVVGGGIAYGLGWIGETGQVAQDEFGPKAALEKYEWFIDQAKAITKADKDIALYEARRQDIEKQYASYGPDKTKWSPAIQAQYNQAAQTAREDLLSIVSNRNGLVKEYNAQSEKFNWALFQTRPDKPAEKFFDYIVK